MTEHVWASPGGVYRVPEGWRRRFEAEFPDYRVRWSLRRHAWQVEQKCGVAAAMPPLRIDPFDDDLIRAADGFWKVMEFQPGSRMGCREFLQFNAGRRETCGATLKVPFRRSAEVVCGTCRSKKRDGRFIAAFWPFDEALLEHLRYSDPLRGGIRRQKVDSDARNAAILAEAERTQSNIIQSIDAVDHRWITGIPSSSGRVRRTIDERDMMA